jgi:hypothetical protein
MAEPVFGNGVARDTGFLDDLAKDGLGGSSSGPPPWNRRRRLSAGSKTEVHWKLQISDSNSVRVAGN